MTKKIERKKLVLNKLTLRQLSHVYGGVDDTGTVSVTNQTQGETRELTKCIKISCVVCPGSGL